CERRSPKRGPRASGLSAERSAKLPGPPTMTLSPKTRMAAPVSVSRALGSARLTSAPLRHQENGLCRTRACRQVRSPWTRCENRQRARSSWAEYDCGLQTGRYSPVARARCNTICKLTPDHNRDPGEQECPRVLARLLHAPLQPTHVGRERVC